MLEARKPRLFAVSMDGSAIRVSWKSELSDPRLAPCDLYERALNIEAVDHLPISFKREDDGSYAAAIYQKTQKAGQLENVIYMMLDLNNEQKYCLEDFSIFIRQSHATIKNVRSRSFHSISKMRIWRTFKQSTGWESLNACEMDVLDALKSRA